jgi:hypothetical protein
MPGKEFKMSICMSGEKLAVVSSDGLVLELCETLSEAIETLKLLLEQR